MGTPSSTPTAARAEAAARGPLVQDAPQLQRVESGSSAPATPRTPAASDARQALPAAVAVPAPAPESLPLQQRREEELQQQKAAPHAGASAGTGDAGGMTGTVVQIELLTKKVMRKMTDLYSADRAAADHTLSYLIDFAHRKLCDAAAAAARGGNYPACLGLPKAHLEEVAAAAAAAAAAVAQQEAAGMPAVPPGAAVLPLPLPPSMAGSAPAAPMLPPDAVRRGPAAAARVVQFLLAPGLCYQQPEVLQTALLNLGAPELTMALAYVTQRQSALVGIGGDGTRGGLGAGVAAVVAVCTCPVSTRLHGTAVAPPAYQLAACMHPSNASLTLLPSSLTPALHCLPAAHRHTSQPNPSPPSTPPPPPPTATHTHTAPHPTRWLRPVRPPRTQTSAARHPALSMTTTSPAAPPFTPSTTSQKLPLRAWCSACGLASSSPPSPRSNRARRGTTALQQMLARRAAAPLMQQRYWRRRRSSLRWVPASRRRRRCAGAAGGSCGRR